MKTIMLSGVMMIVSGFAVAQSIEEQHEIDKQLDECLEIEENQTTYGMMSCIGTARDAWDTELNKNYKLLMSSLSDEQKELLREAQRQWLKYRDAEFSFSSDMHYGMDGTMWRITAADRSKDIVKVRALELKQYYNTLNYGE